MPRNVKFCKDRIPQRGHTATVCKPTTINVRN
jgi:hypothetical protein